MTIHELLQAAGLTANDEIPIWDADGTGEPTKKITAQQLAAAVVALANLVTGVKGNAESSFRTGDVNLTPANIGAVATSAVIDIPHGGTGATTAAVVISNEYTSVLDVINSIANTRAFPINVQKSGYSIYNDMPTGFEGTEWSMVLTGDATRCIALLYIYENTGVFKRDYFNSTGVGIWNTGWIKVSPITPGDIGAVSTSAVIDISHGGTGMTDAETFTQYTSNIESDGRTRILRWGNIYIAHIAGYCGTTITAEVTPMLSLMDSNYAPSQTVYAVFATLSNEPFVAYIDSSGNLYSLKGLEQGTWIYGEIMWFAGK
jgi:hypothetical protein